VELIIVRHAIAFERDASRWPDDRGRPLTPKGETRFRKAARGLGRLVSGVDIVLCSPLVRAWQTAEILADEADWPQPARLEALEPDRTAKDVVEALGSYRSKEVVVLVGHEPLLGELIASLVTGSDEADAFTLKKGGAACVAVDGPAGERAALRWLLTPKIERALRD
jgi:phosphohistidine phosphatase